MGKYDAEKYAAARILAEKISDLLREHALMTDDGPALLLGFGLVAEWKSPASERWLSETHADAAGDPLPEWTLAGYYSSAMDGWDPEEEEDEDESE